MLFESKKGLELLCQYLDEILLQHLKQLLLVAEWAAKLVLCHFSGLESLSLRVQPSTGSREGVSSIQLSGSAWKYSTDFYVSSGCACSGLLYMAAFFLHSFSERGKVLTTWGNRTKGNSELQMLAMQAPRNACSCVGTSAHVSSETQKFFPALTGMWGHWCHHFCTHLSGHSYTFVWKKGVLVTLPYLQSYAVCNPEVAGCFGKESG